MAVHASPRTAGDPPAVRSLVAAADIEIIPLRSADELAASPAGLDADIAQAATAPAVGDDVLVPLRAYIRGHATGDPAHFREAFLSTAHIEGLRDGTFVSWRLDDYCALFDGQPAALLIFTIHKHQVTVFLSQQPTDLVLTGIPKSRAGFTIHSATASHLHIIAVSDVNPAELDLLIAALARAQG